MDVSIISTGNIGRRISTLTLTRGHRVIASDDDDDAKAVVSQLVGDGGLRPVDAGPLARAHELEALGFLHMALQEPVGTGFTSSVKVLS